MCVNRLARFQFLRTHLSKDLAWTVNRAAPVKKGQQGVHILWVERRNHLEERLVVSSYRGTIDPLLMYGIL